MRILWIIIALIAAGSVWFFGFRSEASSGSATDADRDLVHEVERGSFRITVTENGSLVARESSRIQPEIKREGKITYLIDEGAEVEEGEILAKLDPTTIESEIESLDLDLLQATADLENAITEKEIQVEENKGEIEKAAVAVDKSEKDLERFVDGQAPQKRRELEIEIKNMETEFKKKEEQFNDSMRLFDQEYIRKSEMEQDELDYERSGVQLESSRMALELYEKYDYPIELSEKELARKDAIRGEVTSEKRANSKLKQKDVAITRYQEQVSKIEKLLKDKREEVDKMILRAPCPGIVIRGDPRWRMEELKVGASVYPRQTLMTIPDLRVMMVKIQVHEADINKVKEGLNCKVTMDTYPGLVLDSTVTKVAMVTTNSDMYGSAVRKFDVEVTIESKKDVDLRPGISAKVEIFVDERVDVLFIPLQCVFMEEGVHYCHVSTSDHSFVKREVTPGPSNDSFVEIESGLEPGEMVLLYNPELSQNATENTENGEEDALTESKSPEQGSSQGDEQ